MATCINTNLPEFGELEKKFKSKLKAYAAVNQWQSANNSDKIPTYIEIRDMFKVQEELVNNDIEAFSKQLLGNLVKNDLVTKTDAGYAVTGTTQQIKEKTRRIKGYLYINNIPQALVSVRKDSTDAFATIGFNPEVLSKYDVIPSNRSNNSSKTRAVLAHLQKIFPQVKIEEMPSWAASEIFFNIPREDRANVDYEEVNSFYDPVSMTTYILTDRVTDETAIEEMLHPFVSALNQDNKALFNSLLKEAAKTFPQLRAKIERLYSDEKGFNQLTREKELVTQALTRHFKRTYEKEPTQSFLDKVKDFLQWFFATIVNTLYRSITGKSLKSTRIEDVQRQVEQFSDVTEKDIQQVQDIFSKDKRLANAVYYNTGISKEVEDTNLAQRRAKYAAQNKIMQAKRQTFANNRGMDATLKELKKINTPESNLLADLMTVEQVNIKAKSFDYRTPEGKAKSQAQYDIKNKLLVKIFNQYKELGYEVKYEPSFIPGIRHTLFFTIPNTDIQLSYHGNYETIESEIVQLPEGKWDKIPGATFHKLEEAALGIIGEENNDKTEWRNGIDLGQQFTQIDFVPTPEEKMFAENIYAEYMKEMSKNPETAEILNSKLNADTFKNYFNNKLADAAANIESIELTVDMIQPSLKLSDVAKMLNTSDVLFSFNVSSDTKIEYSLSEERKVALNTVLSTSNATQKAIINKITEMQRVSRMEANEFSAVTKGSEDIVVQDNQTGKFINLKTGEVYRSITDDIFGGDILTESESARKVVGDDINKILEAVVIRKSVFDLELSVLDKDVTNGVSQAQVLYSFFNNEFKALTRDGSVILPNVVVSGIKDGVGVADKIDFLHIDPSGYVKIINFNLSSEIDISKLDEMRDVPENSVLFSEYASISNRSFINVRQNAQKRMLESVLGTDSISNETDTLTTYLIKVGIENDVYKGTVDIDQYFTYQSADPDKTDLLIADMGYQDAPDITDMFYDDKESYEEDEYYDAAMDEMQDIKVLTRGLETYKKGLIDRLEALQKIRSSIFIEGTKKQEEVKIEKAISQISIALNSESLSELNSTYYYFLSESIKQVKKFKYYLENPDNFADDKYITFALNAKRFSKTYEGLHSTPNAINLNKRLTGLMFELQTQLNDLNGTYKDDISVTNQAIINHVTATLKKTTTQELTDEEFDEILKYAQDISQSELNFRDLATSRDAILRSMNKIYHNKKMKALDAIDEMSIPVQQVLSKLYKLAPSADRQKLFDYMLNPDGTYVRRIGRAYYDKLDELRAATHDPETGEPLEYIIIDDLSRAKKEDIEHNIKLKKAKMALSEYLKAEQTDEDGNYVDGDYRRYTDYFKQIRDKYEYYDVETESWIRRANIDDADWTRYEVTYFNSQKNITVLTDKNGNPTGQTKELPGRFVKPEVGAHQLIEIRDVSAKGENLLDERYIEIFNPKDELGKAQLEFYKIYDHVYNKLLKKLTPGVRSQMTGRIPLIVNRLLHGVDDKSNIVTKLFSKMSRGFKSFTEDTLEQRSVIVDENGDLIDTLPMYYIGKPRTEEELIAIENEIEVLQQQFKDEKINRDDYDAQMRVLKGKRKKIRQKPLAKELDRDLGSSLLKFISMAEHFSVMTEAEDTLNAFIKVIENRKYDPSSDKTVLGKFKGDKFEKKSMIDGKDTNTFARAKKFMKMVFYDNERVNKGTLDKIVDGALQYTSLAYVGLNPFGSFNNYAFARISNYIEVLGGSRYFDRKAYIRAEKEFNASGIPGLLKKLSMSKPKSREYYDIKKHINKYEAMVDYFRMMDEKADLREQTASFSDKSWFGRMTNWAYVMQDAGEYNVQSKVGVAILMTKHIKNSKTGEVLSLYDAYDYNNQTGKVEIKEGFDTLLEKDKSTGKWKQVGKFDNEARYDIRSNIREVNKQIHGNYAKDDRMVIQSHTLGKLAAQFHKWVAPAINARFQKEYYDENLGWMEGRYLSWYRYLKEVFRQAAKGNLNMASYNKEFKKHYGFKGDGSQADQKIENRLQGFYRTTAELSIIGMIFMLKTVLQEAFNPEDDDDDVSDTVKKFRNFLLYQTDRTHKDMLIFTPFGFEELYQMFKSPIASTRTLGDMGRALSSTVWTTGGYVFREDDESFYANKDYVYQRGANKGQVKMSRYWQDVVPLLRTIKRWDDFLVTNNYFIK